MEHDEAIQTNAAERYLLGEVTAAEADSFEEHYFDCRVCAEDMREGARLLESGRDIVRDERESGEAVVVPFDSHPKRRPMWLPIAIAAVLALGIALPSLLDRARRSESNETATVRSERPLTFFLRGISRGTGGENLVVLGAHKDLQLNVDVAPPPTPYPRYDLTVRDARGKTIANKSVAAEETEEPVPLLLRELPAGSYEVVIEGVPVDGNRSKITALSFQVRK
jgi:hypothetical protein